MGPPVGEGRSRESLLPVGEGARWADEGRYVPFFPDVHPLCRGSLATETREPGVGPGSRIALLERHWSLPALKSGLAGSGIRTGVWNARVTSSAVVVKAMSPARHAGGIRGMASRATRIGRIMP